MELFTILAEAVSGKASDVHLVVGMPPTMRLDGALVTMPYESLSAETTQQLIYQCLNDEKIIRIKRDKEIDVSFYIDGLSHFRMNVYHRMGQIEAAIRIIPLQVPPLAELGLPLVVEELTRKNNGLILITGPAGMGKTTTMAAMIDFINKNHSHLRIITIEDPIEYIHHSNNAVVIQREVGRDTDSFGEGLRQALRQDPNWICIGEMRDLETISIALTAAETGHLVLATLHSPDAVIAIDRIINIFPKNQQSLMGHQLSGVLQGIISQRLLPRLDGNGRVLALEILIANPAVRNVIRTADITNLNTIISTSSSDNMVSLDTSLAELYCKGIIGYETAKSHVKDFKAFRLLTRT